MNCNPVSYSSWFYISPQIFYLQWCQSWRMWLLVKGIAILNCRNPHYIQMMLRVWLKTTKTETWGSRTSVDTVVPRVQTRHLVLGPLCRREPRGLHCRLHLWRIPCNLQCKPRSSLLVRWGLSRHKVCKDAQQALSLGSLTLARQSSSNNQKLILLLSPHGYSCINPPKFKLLTERPFFWPAPGTQRAVLVGNATERCKGQNLWWIQPVEGIVQKGGFSVWGEIWKIYKHLRTEL